MSEISSHLYERKNVSVCFFFFQSSCEVDSQLAGSDMQRCTLWTKCRVLAIRHRGETYMCKFLREIRFAHLLLGIKYIYYIGGHRLCFLNSDKCKWDPFPPLLCVLIEAFFLDFTKRNIKTFSNWCSFQSCIFFFLLFLWVFFGFYT